MHYKKGVVVSVKGNKTVVVVVTGKKMHPKYGKYYTVSKKFYAHDEDNRYKEGDEITIRLVRPLSKMKRWLCVPEESIGKMREKTISKQEAKKKETAEMVSRMVAKIKQGSAKTVGGDKKEVKKSGVKVDKKSPVKETVSNKAEK